MRNIKDVVNRPDWQEIRAALVGTWKHEPVVSIGKLRVFLGVIQDAEDEKLRIVHNYLTGSGFRIGMISHDEINRLLDEVRKARKRILSFPLDFCPKVSYNYNEDKNKEDVNV